MSRLNDLLPRLRAPASQLARDSELEVTALPEERFHPAGNAQIPHGSDRLCRARVGGELL